MFTEQEIFIITSTNQTNKLADAYKALAAFKAGEAKITFNAIRVANGFASNPDFEKLIDGSEPTPPTPDEYRAKRKDIRYNNWGSDDVPEEKQEKELKEKYPDLGFHGTNWQQERAEDNPNKK